MHMFVLVHVMSGGQVVGQKSYVYCLSFHETNSFLYDISQCLTCQLGKHWCGLLICESIWLPYHSPISCLDNVSPFCILLLSTLVSLKFFVCIPAHFLVDVFLSVVHHVCSGCHYYCCGWPCLSMVVDCF